VEETFGKETIAGTAESAGSLADKILEDGISGPVYFFCGDRRRDELPGKLRAHGIRLEERVVYKTHELAGLIERHYDGILFFSPSAVEGFFKTNKAGEGTILFAIGQTTAAEIKKHCSNRVYISEYAGKEKLLEAALSFFRPGSTSEPAGTLSEQ
jgi:uroporphyrinogen-III synthase